MTFGCSRFFVRGQNTMRAPIIAALIASFIPAAVLAQGQTQTQTQTQTQAKSYSTASTIGELMADPAAKAVLAKHFPMALDGGPDKEMTLKELHDNAPSLLTEKIMADIDADLAKLPKK